MHSSTAVRNADEADFGVDPEGVPHAYRRAVTEFASQLNLDADALVQGGRLDSGGLGFWLQHYGKRDPKAITVFVDLGQLPSEPELQVAVYRQLLEKNVTSGEGGLVTTEDERLWLEVNGELRQQASIGFEATMQVRNKLLSAYKEIMSMPV